MTELPQATSRRELREREQAAHVPRRRPRGGRRVLSLATMLFIGAIAISVSVPSNLFAAPTRADAATRSSALAAGGLLAEAALPIAAGPAQSATVSSTQTSPTTSSPDGFEVQSYGQLLAQQYASTGSYTYTKGKGAVRWPFIGQAAISSPFGPRAPLFPGGSDFHNGTDFLVGEGNPVFSIAAGVVVAHEEDGADLGNNVTIRHKIGGAVVTSIYAHMQAGSSPLVVGQTVKVGQFVGLVGATGEATGPHLHLGITVNGVLVDPVPWMEAHVR